MQGLVPSARGVAVAVNGDSGASRDVAVHPAAENDAVEVVTAHQGG